MNENIDLELNFYIRTIGVHIGGNEKNKIMDIIGKFASNDSYMQKIKDEIAPLANDVNFNINSDVPELIKRIIEINKHCDFYKMVTVDRMQFVIYGILYTTLYKNNTTLLNSIDLSLLRLNFTNAMELILLPSHIMQIPKEDCINCIARTFSLLSFLSSKFKI